MKHLKGVTICREIHGIANERRNRKMDTTEELRLIRKAVRGNPDAYGRLIVLYQEYLYKIAFLYMKNEQDALDLVGSTILKGFQNIRTLKKPEWFKTWLTRILINTAKDELKKIIYYDEIDENRLSHRYKAVSLEEQLDLNSAIERLPEKYRMVIVLKYFSELSVREIAYIMSAPEGTIKAYLSRARDELKKTLKEDYFYAG